MHFTREPIVESVLSARDGYKLVLKNSKSASTTDVSAEVIEIVSFAGTLFYRSQDRSKNFLLPASDFELSEVKDARLVLKNISLEKSNKLNNLQREALPSDSELHDEALQGDDELPLETEGSNQAGSESKNNRLERRRERRRNRRRRHSEDKKEGVVAESTPQDEVVEKVQAEENNQPIVPTLNLIPPPPTLISQTLARYKDKTLDAEANPTIVVEDNFDKQSFEPPLEPEDLV